MRKKLKIISTIEHTSEQTPSEGQKSTQVEHTSGQTPSEVYLEQDAQSTQNAPLPKKVRGHTRKQEIWDLESTERIVVTVDESGQPVGDEGNELTKFLGTLARMPQHVGIDVDDWRKISKEKKEYLWNLVEEKISFVPQSEQIKKWVTADIGEKWKSWKYELKRKSYDPSLTVDEIVDAQTDSRVDKIQFKKLATHWFSDKTQAESEKNKKIRSKSNEPHVTGTRSFARIIHEETKKTGVRPSRATIYRKSRTRKDGSIVNSFASEIVGKLNEISDATGGSDSIATDGGVMDWRNDAFAKVKGPEKGGRIRCVGKVVVAKGQGYCPQQDQVPVLKSRINELEDEVRQMREKQDVMLRFMSAVKDQLPNVNFSNILTDLNVEVANDSFSAYEHRSNVNPTSSRASQNHISDPRNKSKR